MPVQAIVKMKENECNAVKMQKTYEFVQTKVELKARTGATYERDVHLGFSSVYDPSRLQGRDVGSQTDRFTGENHSSCES